MWPEKIKFNSDKKYDLQLDQALIDERRLAEIFTDCDLEKIELKTERFLWERYRRIAIEYRCDGKPSGISTTKADMWVHELKRDGQTLVYLMFPIDRIKELARQAIREGRKRPGGDGGRAEMALVRLSDILR